MGNSISDSEIFVDCLCGTTAFGDRPDDERLPAAHIARGENTGDGTRIISLGGNIPASVERYAELLDHTQFDGACEPKREQHEIGLNHEFGSGERIECGRGAHAHRVELCYVTVCVAREFG